MSRDNDGAEGPDTAQRANNNIIELTPLRGANKGGRGSRARKTGLRAGETEVGEHGRLLPVTTLTDDMKHRLVELNAQFHGVLAVASIFEREFGVPIDTRTVRNYDASRREQRMGKRLQKLFWTIRDAYVRDTARIGISHQNHRLKMLERIVASAESMGDYAAALKGLEQAAKEMGGVLTNVSKTKVEGQVAHMHMSLEDARAELAQRLRAAMDGGTLKAIEAIEDKSLEDKDNPDDLT